MNKLAVLSVLVLVCSAVYGTSPARKCVYRYSNNDGYFYTTNWRDVGVNVIGRVGRNGYRYEGPAFYVYDRPYPNYAPFYRFVRNGLYVYSLDRNEFRNDLYVRYDGVLGYLPRGRSYGARRLYRYRDSRNPWRFYYTTNQNDRVSPYYKRYGKSCWVY
jgi:hypothetical protein